MVGFQDLVIAHHAPRAFIQSFVKRIEIDHPMAELPSPQEPVETRCP
jgi:hypothetical protein